MSAKRNSSAIESAICQCPFDLTKLYKQSLAIEPAIARIESEVRESLACASFIAHAPGPLVGGDLIDRARYTGAASLAGLYAVRDIITTHPDLSAATALLGPLFAELEDARQRETNERLAHSAAEDALAIVEAAALTKAKLAIASQPDVVKARTAVEIAATPIRGRQD